MIVEPLSTLQGVSTVCYRGAKALFALYKYIDDIQKVPDVVEQLTHELSAVNSLLQELKVNISLHSNSNDDNIRRFATESEKTVVQCGETFTLIVEMIDKSKIETNRASSDGQIVKCIRWKWSEEQVSKLKARLEGYKSSLSLMMDILNGYALDLGEHR